MLPLKNKILGVKNTVVAAIRRVIGANRGGDALAAEQAAYAEIGRIVCIPFSVANVYERFASQVALIIPFDLIVITRLFPERDSFTIVYNLGTDVVGLAQAENIPLKDSVVSKVGDSKGAIRTDQHPDI